MTFSSKSQKVAAVRQPGELLIDTTPLWRTLFNPATGAERTDDEARVVRGAMFRALELAAAAEMDGWAIVAVRDAAKLASWLSASKQGKALLVTEPWDVLRKRARQRGPTCEELLAEWDGYEDDEALAAVTEPWMGERTMEDHELEYRRACDATAVTECGERIQNRVLLDVCELRADDDDNPRMVRGIAVRYGDYARLGSIRERIKRGALQLPEGPANLTLQHDRAQPLGIIEWQDGDDALRLSADLPEGMRQDQVLADIRAGLLRGLSLEFVPVKDRRIPADDNEKADVWEIEEARVIRCSVVDDGAYPKSKIAQRAGCGCGGEKRQQVEVKIDGTEVEAAVRRALAEIQAPPRGYHPASSAYLT